MIKLNINPRGKPRPRVTRWSTYSPDWYVLYAEKLKEEAELNNYVVPEVLENVTFVIQMAKSWSKKKKLAHDGQPHKDKPDLDNILKGFKDALCENDSYVHTYNNITKIWGYEGAIICQ